jgi:hypothetical protein
LAIKVSYKDIIKRRKEKGKRRKEKGERRKAKVKS